MKLSVPALTKPPLWWAFVLFGNVAGLATACHRGSVGLAIFHGFVGALAFTFWCASMGSKT
jgi:hypothetical protein